MNQEKNNDLKPTNAVKAYIENIKNKIIDAYYNQSANHKQSNDFSREKLTSDLSKILNNI